MLFTHLPFRANLCPHRVNLLKNSAKYLFIEDRKIRLRGRDAQRNRPLKREKDREGRVDDSALGIGLLRCGARRTVSQGRWKGKPELMGYRPLTR